MYFFEKNFVEPFIEHLISLNYRPDEIARMLKCTRKTVYNILNKIKESKMKPNDVDLSATP